MSGAGRVTYQTDGAVGRITVDRPSARNALTPAMYAELDAACAAATADPALRCVVVRGAGGKSFASGSDIAQFRDFETAEDGLDYERRMAAHLANLANIPVPTLAVIEGFAVGGGLNIAACCDLRIATSGTKFGTPIARALGNALSIANYARLVACFGEGHARRMLLLGDLLDVADILPTGFLTRVVDPEALEGTVDELVAQICANAPLSMRTSKAALARLGAGPLPVIDDLIGDIYASGDFREGVAAFFDKRKPTWNGK